MSDAIAALREEMAEADHAPDMNLALAEARRRGSSEADYAAAEIARIWFTNDAELIAAIRAGENVAKKNLSVLLRRNARLPADIRACLAGRLDGTSKPRGRPSRRFDSEYLTQRVRYRIAARLVREQHDENKAAGMKSGKPGSGDPYREALAQVAREWRIEEETLDKHVYPRSPTRRSRTPPK